MFTTKTGQSVYIRHPRKEDLAGLLTFINSLIKEDTWIMRSGKKITRKEEEIFLTDTLKKIRKKEKYSLLAIIDGRIVGSAEIRRQSLRKHHVGEIGISVLAAYREAGIGTYLMKQLIQQAEQMELRLLYLHSFADNKRAIHVYEKVGFRLAGEVPGMLAYKGKYLGEVTMYLPLSIAS